MNAERWALVERICADALELDTGERSQFLAHECGSDADLRHEVQSLIDQLDSEPDFLEQGAIVRPPLVERSDLTIGDSVGVFRLERLLGRGGMGEVYLAARDVDGVSQHVALKVIRRGMDSDEVVRRFSLERRILAGLRHTNVAQLIDVGTLSDGRPYFVMEYVEGVPITEYARDNQLTIQQRLRLFQRVCTGVQHAHQRLVVHRDLKPGNILVDAAGSPKLLDFGIGKVLDDAADNFGVPLNTRAELRVLTPQYAAPEQITGAPVTTATDVYALGVILYELLTGEHPYTIQGTSRADVERAVVESAPLRPSQSAARGAQGGSNALRDGRDPVAPENFSQLSSRLRGDLDTIVMMALRKEPERRYSSAAALADDVERHLSGHPVRARADTLGYRVQKFVGRNKGTVIGASALVVSLLAIAGISVVQSRRVAEQATRTALERDKALEVRGFLMEMFGAANADQAIGDTISVRSLLDRQRAQIDEAFAGRDLVKADLLDALADGYDRLGLYSDAEPLARRALDLRTQLLPKGHPDIATSLNLLGWILHQRGRGTEAEALLLDAARIRRGISEERSVDGLSRSLNDLGVVYNALGRYADAERVLREALEIRQRANGDTHRSVGVTANNLSAALYYQKKLSDAVPVQALAVSALQASVGADHQRTVLALSNLATFKRVQGDLEGAEADYRELAARQTRLQGRQHPVTAHVLTSLASLLTERAVKEKRDTLLIEAEFLHREALSTLESRLGARHEQVGLVLDRIATVLLLRAEPRDAASAARRAVSILRLNAPDSSRAVQQAVRRLVAAERQAGDSASAKRLARQFNQQ